MKTVFEEHDDKYVEPLKPLFFVKNNPSQFIWQSNRDGWDHLYLYSLNGILLKQLTKGNMPAGQAGWEVTEVKGFDETGENLFYVATEESPVTRNLYQVNLKTGISQRITKGAMTHEAKVSSSGNFVIDEFSSTEIPRTLQLIDVKAVKSKQLFTAPNPLAGFRLGKLNIFTINNRVGIPLYCRMYKPVNFDSTKKYPVYMYAYGGPGGTEANNAWDGNDYLWHNLLAQEGYIVVCVDNRGTMGRGRNFKHATYLQLGKLETEDQIAVAKQLQVLSYVDKSRIGFQGWSYGGYMASLMISKGADVIKMAIAVAPVTNWKYYDNIYTERFLRKPQDNKSGYEDNSPTNFVKNIKGRFLLIHGAADDNVHMQNSMELADALVRNNIPFDFMLYPNKNHGISGGPTRLHIYTKILKFVKENL
jgi:dipeptidyl-peptidase-4